MAIEHKDIDDAELHEPKGAASALSGTVYVADGAGSGAWAVQEEGASTVTQVETVTDFPTPVADVITLAPGCVYQINTIVDCGANRFVFSEGSILKGIHRTISGITSTTTGSLFTGTGVNMRMETLTLNATTATHLYTFDGSGTKVFSARDMLSVTHTGDVASITASLNTVFDFSLYSGGVNGVKFFGTHPGASLMTACGFFAFTGIGVDFGTAVMSGFRIESSSIFGDGVADTSISGLTGSGNIATGTFCYIALNNLMGSNTTLAGITYTDIRFVFENNNGVENTQRECQTYFTGGGLTTTIAVINTPVLLNGTALYVENHAEQFTTDANGRCTYDGVNDIDVTAIATVTGTGASGTNNFTVYIAKDGVVEAATAAHRAYTSTAEGQCVSMGIITMSTGEYLEIWIEGNDGTTDFDATDANLIIRS